MSIRPAGRGGRPIRFLQRMTAIRNGAQISYVVRSGVCRDGADHKCAIVLRRLRTKI